MREYDIEHRYKNNPANWHNNANNSFKDRNGYKLPGAPREYESSDDPYYIRGNAPAYLLRNESQQIEPELLTVNNHKYEPLGLRQQRRGLQPVYVDPNLAKIQDRLNYWPLEDD